MVEKITVGMQGISAESIASGKRGFCWFPIGKPDAAYHGGKAWVRVQIHAIEDIREQRDVIVADDQGGVKEHTPVELSYQSREGPYQRVTEDSPLPVTAASKAITHVTVVVPASLEIVKPSSSAVRIRVHYFAYSNPNAVIADVGMRFTASGDIAHRHHLPASGGNVNANLIDANWQGGDGETLYAASEIVAQPAVGVYVTIGYTEEP